MSKEAKQIARAKVNVHGLRPLLMSSPKEVLEGSQGRARKTSQDYIDEEEAEKRAYKDKDGFLVVPARCIMACLIKASKLYRTKGAKGISLSDMIKGSVFIDPDEVRIKDSNGKFLKNYEIDLALVVVQRHRIRRARPRIDDWNLEFEIRWNTGIYGLKGDDLKRVVGDAGYIGLLDWRPRFGIFELKSFETLK